MLSERSRQCEEFAPMSTTKTAKTAANKTSSDKPSASTPRLEDFMCFAVYSANLAFGRAYKPILEKLGLTYTLFFAFVVLWVLVFLSVGGLGVLLFLVS